MDRSWPNLLRSAHGDRTVLHAVRPVVHANQCISSTESDGELLTYITRKIFVALANVVCRACKALAAANIAYGYTPATCACDNAVSSTIGFPVLVSLCYEPVSHVEAACPSPVRPTLSHRDVTTAED